MVVSAILCCKIVSPFCFIIYLLTYDLEKENVIMGLQFDEIMNMLGNENKSDLFAFDSNELPEQ